MADKQKYLVIAGFLGTDVINDDTGQKALHHRGDSVDLTDDEAGPQLHSGRIVAYDEAKAASIAAEIQAQQERG